MSCLYCKGAGIMSCEIHGYGFTRSCTECNGKGDTMEHARECIVCPRCHGTKREYNVEEGKMKGRDCRLCDGHGEVVRRIITVYEKKNGQEQQ